MRLFVVECHGGPRRVTHVRARAPSPLAPLPSVSRPHRSLSAFTLSQCAVHHQGVQVGAHPHCVALLPRRASRAAIGSGGEESADKPLHSWRRTTSPSSRLHHRPPVVFLPRRARARRHSGTHRGACARTRTECAFLPLPPPLAAHTRTLAGKQAQATARMCASVYARSLATRRQQRRVVAARHVPRTASERTPGGGCAYARSHASVWKRRRRRMRRRQRDVNARVHHPLDRIYMRRSTPDTEAHVCGCAHACRIIRDRCGESSCTHARTRTRTRMRTHARTRARIRFGAFGRAGERVVWPAWRPAPDTAADRCSANDSRAISYSRPQLERSMKGILYRLCVGGDGDCA